MRRLITFECEGASLAGTLDEAGGTTGLLIVSGGNEIRVGSHRGMARLARDVAAAGYPVLRFDRRGIGDSDGENAGFEGSGPDIAAAVSAFRRESAISRIVAFGNCDAASALVLHKTDQVDALVLANVWTIEPEEGDALPPPAAIKAQYMDRLRDPKALLRLLTGKVNLGNLLRGLGKLARKPRNSGLAHRIADGMTSFAGPIDLVVAERDGTALAFLAEWDRPVFDRARERVDITMTRIASSSHSFADDADYAELCKTILRRLKN